MPRANLVDHKNKVVISVNYKCASSSIIRWFVKNIDGYKHENTTMSGTINRKYVFSDKKLNKFNNYYKVLIVRNPFNRVISAFLDKGFHNFMPLKNLCKKHKTSIPNLTFKKFIYILYKERGNKMNGHWAPLSIDNKPKIYNKVIKMEFLEKHMNSLVKRFNYKVFPIKIRSKKNKNISLWNKPIKKLKTMSLDKVKNYKNYFNSDIVEIINEIYKDDLKLFKYSYQKFCSSYN